MKPLTATRLADAMGIGLASAELWVPSMPTASFFAFILAGLVLGLCIAAALWSAWGDDDGIPLVSR